MSELETALRKFEAAHKVWMNTSVFTAEGQRAKENKDRAMREYDQACQRSREDGEVFRAIRQSMA